MTEKAKAEDRMRAVLAAFATTATIVFNGFATAGWVNRVTPQAVADKYPTILTPANYAFSIWILIYLGIAGFAVYQMLPTNLARFRSVRSLYIFSCLLNCGWVYFWHREQIGVCLILILALAADLVFLLLLFRDTVLPKSIFGLYAGWVSAAAATNFAIFLKYEAVDLSDFAWDALGVVLIILATSVAVVVRWKLKNYIYPLAIAWAFTAIAVKQGGHTAVVVAAAFAVVICTITAGSFVVDLKDSTSE